MPDTDEIIAEAAAAEAVDATLQAEMATAEAQRATRDAELATAMAAGASIAQSELVGQTMEYAREDAQQEAIKAEIAAEEAQEAATDAVATNVALLAQNQKWQESIDRRLAMLEARLLAEQTVKDEVQEEATPQAEEVTEINPEAAAANEGEAEVEAEQAEEGTRVPSKNRRAHGRRRRR